MKEINIGLVFFSIVMLNPLRAQNAVDERPLDRKLSIATENISLPAALTLISEKSGVRFVYDDGLFENNAAISLDITGKSVVEILEEILEGREVGFVVQSSSQVVLTRKSTISRRYGTIKGRVVHAVTGDPLSDANVTLSGTSLGTASDAAGFFRMRAPAGRHEVQTTMMGFKSSVRRVEVKANAVSSLLIRLQPTVIELPQVHVTSSRTPQHMEIEPSVLSVRRSDITAIPTVGEPDLFRALQTLPGVSAPNDYSNELFIRGGGSDQNLILLDGAVVYNPYHLFGLAGAFNPDIVEQVNLSLGGFSARYGDRLSSVIDIRTRTNVSESVKGFGNFSLISSKLALMGQASSKLRWVASARRTYHDFAARLFVGQELPYYFYDMFGKLIYQPNDRTRFSFSSFFSRDIFFYEETNRASDVDDIRHYPDDSLIPEGTGYTSTQATRFLWDNFIFSAQMQHEWSPRLRFDVSLSQSRNPTAFSFNEDAEAAVNASPATREHVALLAMYRDDDFTTDNRILDRSVRMDWTWGSFSGHQFNFGAGFSNIDLDYGWQDLFNGYDQAESGTIAYVFFDQAPDDFDYRRNLSRAYLYFEDLWEVTPALSVRPGLRLEKRDFVSGVQIDPRLNLSYDFNDKLRLKAAYGRFHQGLATSLEDGYIQLLPLPFATDDGLAAESADHFIVGVERRTDTFEVSAEAYYKTMHNLLRATNGQPEFEQGSGKAYGLELGLNKHGDRLDFELTYALSYAKREFNGFDYFTTFDQRHVVTAAGQWDLGKNWRFNFRWTFATGRPFTPRTIFFTPRYFDIATGEWRQPLPGHYARADVNYTRNKNRVRYPLYHRLDIGLTKRFQKQGWALLPYFQILNTYYRRNVLFYDDLEVDPESGGYKPKIFPMMPIIPTIGLSLEF